MSNDVFGQGFSPAVPTQSLWSWNTSTAVPTVSGYPISPGVFSSTKTGLQPVDLQNFVGVPIQFYGNPPRPVNNDTMLQWIRWAEDSVEQKTSILLCQTWVASPPTQTAQTTQAAGLLVNTADGFQKPGYDYDLEDNAYDFQFPRAQDEGWMYQTLRYRPVQSIAYGVTGSGATPATMGVTAVKNTAFIYPLLNVYFRIPPNWNVEDRNFGLIRYVPATNVQMLPLFAMQLSFMGFAESVPGGLWLQYTAGLTQFDYQNRFSFMKQLVLAEAALTALNAIQGGINLGVQGSQITVDGLSYRTQYYNNGPYGPLIASFTSMRDQYLKVARDLVSGPMVNVI